MAMPNSNGQSCHSKLRSTTVNSDNEWSLLRCAIVGRADHSCFPHEPAHMMAATMPPEHRSKFRPRSPFPQEIVQRASEELENFAMLLQAQEVRVYRPETIDWLQVGGYTGAMPRDVLLVVGNTIIESCFAWHATRGREASLALNSILHALSQSPSVRIVRAPAVPYPDTIYEGLEDESRLTLPPSWAINNTRPAFDAADFMRFGRTLLGQLSHVTNMKGVKYIEENLPSGYSVELLEINDPHAMHIDATILPLYEGLLVFNPFRVTEESIRRHAVFQTWEVVAYPFAQDVEKENRRRECFDYVPRFMTSPWLVLNLLVIGRKKVIVEEQDERFAKWLEDRGMHVIKAPFRHVHAIGGSFHCASLDLIRDPLMEII